MRGRTCPRCGQRYSWIERHRVGNRVYLYAVHARTVNGKRNVRKCYLGPEGGYVCVVKTLSALDGERLLGLLEAVLDRLVRVRLSGEERRRAVEMLSGALDRLRAPV